MTSHFDSHRTTDIKLEFLFGVQTVNGIQHDKYNINGIAHVHTHRTDAKMTIARLYIRNSHPQKK